MLNYNMGQYNNTGGYKALYFDSGVRPDYGQPVEGGFIDQHPAGNAPVNYGQSTDSSFQDPHLVGGSCFEYGQMTGRGFQGSHSGYGMGFGEGESMEERFKARKAEQMYQRLAEQGRFSEIDKAKHNEHYRDYLLENFEDELY